jgi:hypothetical protein
MEKKVGLVFIIFLRLKINIRVNYKKILKILKIYKKIILKKNFFFLIYLY